MNQLEDFRKQIDEFMGRHPQSPLDRDAQKKFTGLDYYDENEDLILDVMVERFPEDEPIVTMQTSTGDTQQYRRWGHFSFEVEGKEASLTIYSDPHGHEFFMPFRDSTNGAETYGAGRYLDNHRPGMRKIGTNRFEIDMNYAYNPYCAYSEMYSCPLPPRENWLKVPIRAGEKDFIKQLFDIRLEVRRLSGSFVKLERRNHVCVDRIDETLLSLEEDVARDNQLQLKQ